jgi:mRNA interferase MazF
MSITRGDVVIVDFPQGPSQSSKRRPAVVVQSDHNNSRLTTAILAMVTSNVRLATAEATQVLIDVATPDGQQSGLSRTSAVKCENRYTLPQASILRTIGSLTAPLIRHVDDALKVSLNLP